MVVLHVIRDLFSHGGTPRKLLGLVRASAISGISHAFLVFDDSEDSLAQEMRDEGAVVIGVSRGGALDLRLVADVVGAARRLDAGVISTHFARADILGGCAALRLRIPLVKNVHGIIVNEAPAVLLADRILSAYRAAVICNSHATLRAQERLGLAQRAVVVLNGVEDVRSEISDDARGRLRDCFAIAPDDFVFGHVGGLIASRDQTLLIDAVVALRRSGVAAHCLLVGDGPELPSLRRHAAEIGADAWLTFCGYRDDVPDLLSTMDAYVNMSSAEGFGIAVVEAMQVGLPPVVADAGALPEVVTNGVDGLVVAPGDPGPLTEALRLLACDSLLRERLGSVAQKTALERFSVRRFAEQMNAVFQGLGTNGDLSGA